MTLYSGLPVTTPVRTIADLRRVSSGRAPLVSPKELRRAIRQANFLGLPIGEEERRDRNRSDLEEDFQRLCREHGLPAPEVNVRLGPHLVDDLRARGFAVIRLAEKQIDEEPQRVAEVVGAALRVGADVAQTA